MAQSPDGDRRGMPRFIQVTVDQLAIPRLPRGCVPDGEHLTRLEKLVLQAILALGGQYYRPVTASNLEIADAIGEPGSKASRAKMVSIALHGRVRRKGEPKSPGLAHPSRGWVTIIDGDSRARQIILTPKFREWACKQADLTIARIPVETASSPPGRPAAAAIAPEPEEYPRPADDVLGEVLGRFHVHSRRDVQAGHFRDVLRNKSRGLKLLPDGTILPLLPPWETELDPSTSAVLLYLTPELVVLLEQENRGKAPAAAPAVPAAARRVEGRPEIRAMIGRLPGHTDDGLSRQLAARLAGPAGFADVDRATSEATYFGLFEALRLGRDGVTEAILQDAFEAACGPRCRIRGAVFIAVVQAGLGGRLPSPFPENR